MNTSPRVSIIIPTYNHANFLREALQSIQAQSLSDWEAIVVNNYSEDDTISIVESFRDPRIRLVNFRNNGVIAASRNKGIGLSRGEYLAFLDSDDIWFPEKLAKCLQHFTDDIKLVGHGFSLLGPKRRNIFSGPENRATFASLLYEGNCITPSATVVRRDAVISVGGFSESRDVITAEDYHLWLKLAQAGNKMFFLKDVLAGYRIHSGNQSSSVDKHLCALLSVLNEFFPKSDGLNLKIRSQIRRRYAIAFYGAGRSYQQSGAYLSSLPLLFRSIQTWPFFLKSYMAIVFALVGAMVRKQPRSRS